MKNTFDIENSDVKYLIENLSEVLKKNHELFFNEISERLRDISASEMIPIEKYHQILLLLNQRLQKLQTVQKEQENLIQDLVALIALFTRGWSELKLENSDKALQIRIDQTLQNFTRLLAFDATTFDSLEHYIFCHKWKVSGSMQDYKLWHKITALLTDNLNEHNYTRVVAEILLPFGFDMKSEVVNSEDFNYDQYGTNHHEKVNTKLSIDVKAEIDIWKPENIVKLFINYLQAFALKNNDNISAIEEQAVAIRHYVLVPLFKVFVNQARKLAALNGYADEELHSHLIEYDQKVEQLKSVASKSFADTFQEELNTIAKQPTMLRSILKKIPPIEESTTGSKKETFAEQHPVLFNSLKGFGYGVSAFTLLVGAGALIYTTGGAGAVLIGGVIKTLGLAGSVAVSAAATTVPGGIIGAGVGVGAGRKYDPHTENVKAEKKVHFAADVKQFDGPRNELSYNRYYQKFMKTMNPSIAGINPSLNDVADNQSDDELQVNVAAYNTVTDVPLKPEEKTTTPFEFPNEFRLRM